MPDEFTIGDLQDTYSLILGKELIAPNFRRKMKPMLIDIGKESEDIAGHRPAKLFKLLIIQCFTGSFFPSKESS